MNTKNSFKNDILFELCEKCNSDNTTIVWGKVGTFVSYWHIHCNDCNHDNENRRGSI